MSLLSYQEARPWARSIKAKVMARLMPPWFADPQFGHFRNDRNLAQSEIDTFAAWVDAGAPEGSPQDAPRPLMFPDGWEIKPDLVVEAPPFDVPATGVVEWTSVIFPSGFTKDTWVDSIQIRPSERQVAHHICFGVRNHRDGVEYYKPEAPEVPRDVDGVAFPRHAGDRARPNAQATANRQAATNGPSWDGCYLPGVPALDLTHSNSAKLIPAHADFVIEFHYTTTGKAVTDHVKIGFTVAKEEPSRRFITYATGPTAGTDAEHFRIPANEPNYESTFEGTIMEDAELVWMLPHMHLRGKNMKWMLVYPDGRQDVVCTIRASIRLADRIRARAADQGPKGHEAGRGRPPRQLGGQQVQSQSEQGRLLRQPSMGGNDVPMVWPRRTEGRRSEDRSEDGRSRGEWRLIRLPS